MNRKERRANATRADLRFRVFKRRIDLDMTIKDRWTELRRLRREAKSQKRRELLSTEMKKLQNVKDWGEIPK